MKKHTSFLSGIEDVDIVSALNHLLSGWGLQGNLVGHHLQAAGGTGLHYDIHACQITSCVILFQMMRAHWEIDVCAPLSATSIRRSAYLLGLGGQDSGWSAGSESLSVANHGSLHFSCDLFGSL
jgi:hypothetical protein